MDIFNQRKRRRTDVQVPTYLPHQPGPHQMRFRGIAPAPAPLPAIVNIKSEDPSHSAILPPAARPPSLPTPVAEEEAAPEFIEMSSHPPKLSANVSFAGSGLFPTGEPGSSAAGPSCKMEPRDGTAPPTDGSVQSSSSPPDRTTGTEDVSPLNVRCVKCVTTRVTCAVMPCGHCCLCATCGQAALSLKQVCPVCRKSITTVIGYSNLIYNLYR